MFGDCYEWVGGEENRTVKMWMLVRDVELCRNGANGLGKVYLIPEKPDWWVLEAVQKIRK